MRAKRLARLFARHLPYALIVTPDLRSSSEAVAQTKLFRASNRDAQHAATPTESWSVHRRRTVDALFVERPKRTPGTSPGVTKKNVEMFA